MPFPCIALGAGAGVGLLRCLRPGSENPVAVIVPELVMPNHPEDSFVFSSSPPAVSLSLSLSFIHHSLYIAGMPKLMRTRCTHKPSGLAVGEAHVPHSDARTNTRTHNCFPAK